MREARRSQDKDGEKLRSLRLARGRRPVSSQVTVSNVRRLSSYPVEKLSAPGRASATGTTSYSGEASEHLSIKLSPLIHIQQNSEESETLESSIGGNWTFSDYSSVQYF